MHRHIHIHIRIHMHKHKHMQMHTHIHELSECAQCTRRTIAPLDRVEHFLLQATFSVRLNLILPLTPFSIRNKCYIKRNYLFTLLLLEQLQVELPAFLSALLLLLLLLVD